VTGSKHAASPPASRGKGVALALSWRSPHEMHLHLRILNAISTCQIAYSAKYLQIETQHRTSWTYSDQAPLALEAERRRRYPQNLLTFIH
jgi:hypothetical protein